MELGRYSLSLAVAGLATLLVASMLIWLLLYEPVTLASAVERGDLTGVAEALGRALLSSLKVLVRYL